MLRVYFFYESGPLVQSHWNLVAPDCILIDLSERPSVMCQTSLQSVGLLFGKKHNSALRQVHIRPVSANLSTQAQCKVRNRLHSLTQLCPTHRYIHISQFSQVLELIHLCLPQYSSLHLLLNYCNLIFIPDDLTHLATLS